MSDNKNWVAAARARCEAARNEKTTISEPVAMILYDYLPRALDEREKFKNEMLRLRVRTGETDEHYIDRVLLGDEGSDE